VIKYKTILFDDVCLDIEIIESDERITCIASQEFSDSVQCLLTEKQYENFIADDTSREFRVHDKKIEEFRNYIKDNIWRRQYNKSRNL